MNVQENTLLRASIKAIAIYDANNTVMTVGQCATWMAIHKNTVLRKIHAGEIDANFKGGEWRIPKIQFLDKIIDEFKSTEFKETG